MARLYRSAADLAEHEKRSQGQIPLWVPAGVAAEYERRRLLRILEQQRQTVEMQEEADYTRKDTKPFMLTDRSQPDRPMTVIGGGAMFREDMKDLAKRVLEKPDPKLDPKHRMKHDVMKAIDQRDELIKNLRRGRSSIFHFSSNPIHVPAQVQTQKGSTA